MTAGELARSPSGHRSVQSERPFPLTLQVYYFAMITNVLIRFVFVWYIPARARNTRLRSFFFAVAEMLRRWQWNFCTFFCFGAENHHR